MFEGRESATKPKDASLLVCCTVCGNTLVEPGWVVVVASRNTTKSE